MKKVLCILSSILLLCILFSRCDGKRKYEADYDLYPLCIMEDCPNLTAERKIELNDHYNQQFDTYVIHNSGEETTVKLVFPDMGRYGFSMWIDGKKCDPGNYWAAINATQHTQDIRDHTSLEKLIDGTYFQLAFPNWPELGEPVHKLPPNEENDYYLEPTCGVSFIVNSVTIPANGSVTVAIKLYHADYCFMYHSRLRHLPHEIPLTRETLTIDETAVIKEQNLSEEMPESGSWTVTLDPTREDYHFKCYDPQVRMDRIGFPQQKPLIF